MNKQAEYDALRAEILNSIEAIKYYRSLLYTIVIAALAFAFDKGDAVLFLIPSFIIIPIYLLEMEKLNSQMRISAYIFVFLEPKTECHWETRLYKHIILHKDNYKRKLIPADPYWYLSFGCLSLSVLKLNFANRDYDFYLTIIFQIILLFLIIYVFAKRRLSSIALKEKYINEWM